MRNEVGHAAENTLPERAQAYAGPVPAAFTSLLDRLRVAIGLVYREMIKFGVPLSAVQGSVVGSFSTWK